MKEILKIVKLQREVIELVHGFIMYEIEKEEKEIVEQMLEDVILAKPELYSVILIDEVDEIFGRTMVSIDITNIFDIYEEYQIKIVESTSGNKSGCVWNHKEGYDYYKIMFVDEYLKFLNDVKTTQMEILKEIDELPVWTTSQVTEDDEIVIAYDNIVHLSHEFPADEKHWVKCKFERLSRNGNPIFKCCYDPYIEGLTKLEQQAFKMLGFKG